MISLHTSHTSLPPVRPPVAQPAAEGAPEHTPGAAHVGVVKRGAAVSHEGSPHPAGPKGETRDVGEERDLQRLRARDREVRSHEQAHLSAAGGLAQGGASFQLTRGPDGQSYAVGGEVSIDVSPVANDPQATIAKAQQIQRAALAPANPSAQDRAVAARASAMATEARVELQRQSQATAEPGHDGGICKQCGVRHAAGEDDTTTRQGFSNPYAAAIEAPPPSFETAV